MSMLYPELFKSLEAVRMEHGHGRAVGRVRRRQAVRRAGADDQDERDHRVVGAAGHQMFLRDNRHDSDFSAFMSVWFYEEQKHALVLMEYLKRFPPRPRAHARELHAVRFEFDPAPAPGNADPAHFCGEIRLNHWYRRPPRVAHRAGDSAHLQAAEPGRGAPRRRVTCAT